MEEIKLPKQWVDRLQGYILKVENSQGSQKEWAISALLGYLSSLELLTK